MPAEERWIPVVSWENAYEVSDLGRVRSVERTSESYGGRRWVRPATIRKLHANRCGYLLVTLSDGERYKTVAVHRLIAAAFHGICPDGMTVNHKNGNKKDNAAINLEYCSMADNLRHALRIGLRVNPKGEENGAAKLNESQVREIKIRLAAGESQTTIAAGYCVTNKLIHLIAKRRVWQHV